MDTRLRNRLIREGRYPADIIKDEWYSRPTQYNAAREALRLAKDKTITQGAGLAEEVWLLVQWLRKDARNNRRRLKILMRAGRFSRERAFTLASIAKMYRSLLGCEPPQPFP